MTQPEWLSPDRRRAERGTPERSEGGSGLVDLAAVHRWGVAQGLPDGPITDVRRVGGGTQNVVLRLRWADRDLVLRRPPEHPRASSNDVLRREMRMLQALSGSDVPHPEFVAGSPDSEIVFYLMEAVDGINPGERVEEPYVSDAGARHAAALDTATALARLAAVDHEMVGLGDVGRPEGFLARQVPRWSKHLASYEDLPGYPGSTLPHVDALSRWLEANRPPEARPGIVHGDYHLNNVLLALDAPRVAAIVDWEMCTVGDPLLDLGWLLVTWPAAGAGDGVTGAPLAALGGLPDRDELVAHYTAHSDRDLSALDWYTVLAGFKFAVVVEGTHARALAGQADPDVGLRLHHSAVAALERVAAIAGV